MTPKWAEKVGITFTLNIVSLMNVEKCDVRMKFAEAIINETDPPNVAFEV